MNTLAAALVALAGMTASADQPAPPDEHAAAWMDKSGYDGAYAVVADPNRPRPPFDFSPDDAELLEEIQLAAFRFFWQGQHVNPATGFCLDRSSAQLASVAGIGFQLSAIVIGAERGWVTRAEAEQRALLILNALMNNPTNRKAGLFYHFLDPQTAAPSPIAYEDVVSTVDSALLFAGALTAGSYFGGEVDALARRMIEDADWTFFLAPDAFNGTPYEGFISLGWRAADAENDPTGAGEIIPYFWADAADEQRLVYFLAALSPSLGHRVGPEAYYGLRRGIGAYADTGPMAFKPWSGALFTAFFSHCWIDYARIGETMGPDRPDLLGIEHRAPIDWWENSRRHVHLHRLKAAENPLDLPTFSEHAWGLTACDGPGGYIVPGVFPDLLPMPGARPEFDFPTHEPPDNFGGGTIAPYGAGSAIMFEPEHALAALRYYRNLQGPDGRPLVWRPTGGGGFGFLDSFNLGGPNGQAWVASDYLAIDQGPLLLAIENARSGLVWRTFHAHPLVQDATRRLALCLEPRPDPAAERLADAGEPADAPAPSARPEAEPAAQHARPGAEHGQSNVARPVRE